VSRVLSAVTFAVLASALAISGCRGWESDQPPVHLIPNMDTQEKGRPYRHDDGDRATGVLPDNRWMQPPPDGTIAQGEFIDDDVMVEGRGADGGYTRDFPNTIKPEDVADRGIARLHIYCAPCHGLEGDGDGTVAKRGGLMVPPPSFHEARFKSMPVGQIYSAIKNGVNNFNMPSYAAQIPVEDRWAIVAGVRKLEMARDANMTMRGNEGPTMAAVTKASAQAGEQIYTVKGCSVCHTVDGTKRVGPSWKGIYGKTENTSAGPVTVDDAYIKESILTPMAKIVEGYPPAMPPQQLNDLEIQSVALYIKSLK
jgi:mono/diheme cytochrome c family protein